MSNPSSRPRSSWPAAAGLALLFIAAAAIAVVLADKSRARGGQVADLEKDLDQARKAAAVPAAPQTRLQNQVRQAKATAARVQTQLDQAQVDADKLEAQLARARTETARARADAREAETAAGAQKTQMAQATAALAAVQQQFDALTPKVDHMRAQMRQYAAESGHAANGDDY